VHFVRVTKCQTHCKTQTQRLHFLSIISNNLVETQ